MPMLLAWCKISRHDWLVSRLGLEPKLLRIWYDHIILFLQFIFFVTCLYPHPALSHPHPPKNNLQKLGYWRLIWSKKRRLVFALRAKWIWFKKRDCCDVYLFGDHHGWHAPMNLDINLIDSEKKKFTHICTCASEEKKSQWGETLNWGTRQVKEKSFCRGTKEEIFQQHKMGDEPCTHTTEPQVFLIISRTLSSDSPSDVSSKRLN